MFQLNKDKNLLEGELKLSDCEKEFVVKWLSGSSQASFFIGDSDEDKNNIRDFIDGYEFCFIDLPSFLKYLSTIEHILKKYKSMYYGPFENLTNIFYRFSSMKQEDAKVVLCYVNNDRYIRILNNRKNYAENVAIYGDLALRNGDDFRHSYMGEITKISIKKNENGQYWMYINLIKDWRDKIMQSSGAKVTLEALINIFNSDISDNLNEGKSEAQAAQIFGIKYAPLLEKNKSKFTFNDIVLGSQYNKQEILKAVEEGVSISSAVIWSPDLLCESSSNNNFKYYHKFKHLLSWFVKQVNINNGLEEGTKTSGKGSDGEAIQSKYAEWRDYDFFTLDCTLICDFAAAYSKSNYIHKTGTGINIRPNFDKATKEIKSLFIDLYNIDAISEEISKILDKEYSIDDLSLFDGLEPNDKVKELFDDYVFIINELSKKDEPKQMPVFDFNQCTELIDKGINLVVYGTPGCGKSYHVEHTLLPEVDFPLKEDGTKERVIRTTFYQDYTNTDFVGQILPIVDGDKVTYKFNPGPFTLALVQAIKNPNKKVALVIEELNRGNAPSIFGDIFQLLDRKNGISEYSIVNVNLIKYLNEVFANQYSFKFIKLPANLSIYATMNTSDQNVFTLDTAFKRRWEFLKIPNIFKNDHKFKDKYIPGDNITWEDLVNSINDWILDNSDGYNSEDKQIGVYFVDESGMTSSVVSHGNMNKDEVRKFAYKIMEYLWDDVAKFQRDRWFNDDINSLDKLIEEYMNEGVKVFKDGVIKKHE